MALEDPYGFAFGMRSIVRRFVYLSSCQEPGCVTFRNIFPQKIAIEKGLVGDSIVGKIDINPDNYKGVVLPSPTNGSEDET